MKFGKISNLSDIDFTLPKDLYFVPGKKPLTIKTGLSKWGDKAWLGNFFPETLKQSEFLTHYATLFDAVEVNATYYHIFKPEVGKQWAEKVIHNPSFKFYLKIPAALSGGKIDENYKRICDDYLALVDAMGKSYGGSFLTYNGKESEQSLEFLQNASEVYPSETNLFIELRHPSWFENIDTLKSLGETLTKGGVNMVMTDTPGRRDVLHKMVCNGKCLLRYVGYDFNSYDKTRLEEWRKALEQWQQKGLEEFVILFHNPLPNKAFEMGKYIAD